MWVIPLIVATVALGTWGFKELELSRTASQNSGLTFAQSLYRAIKLYALDIGPAAGPGSEPNWQILLALLLAGLLVVRALLALLGDRVHRTVIRRLLSRHVIVCGAGVHGSQLALEFADRHDIVVVDKDSTAPGMQRSRQRYCWWLTGDATLAPTLLDAGIERASWVVAITGDDFVNTQIASTVETIEGITDGLHVMVQVEDPALARFLESGSCGQLGSAHESDGGRLHGSPSLSQFARDPSAAAVVTSFSANAIAANALLEDCGVISADDAQNPLLKPRDGKAPHVILAGDHPLIDAVVVSAMRAWRVQLMHDLESASALGHPLRLSIYGPDAVQTVERLTRRWRPESQVLNLEGHDVTFDGGLPIEEDDWLLRLNTADYAVVICNRELDGIKVTLGMSRALGDGVRMTRITTQPTSVLDDHLSEHTANDPDLATTEVKTIADLASNQEKMANVAPHQRLVRALTLDLGQEDAEQATERLFAHRELDIHSDATWHAPIRDLPLLRALLSPIPVSAVLRADLAVRLRDVQNLRVAAAKLASQGEVHQSFAAWCECVRLALRQPPGEARAQLTESTGSEIGDAVLELGQKVNLLRGRDARSLSRIAIIAGAAGSLKDEVRREIEPMLEGALSGYDGILISGGTSVGVPGLAGEVAHKLDLRIEGYAPAGKGDSVLYTTLHETVGASDFSEREAIAMWEDLVAKEIAPGDVRLVAFPGGELTRSEIILARALGGGVASLDPAGLAERPIEDLLPFGADEVLELPSDRMTVRAFVRWREPLGELPEALREELARYLHNAYRRRQHNRLKVGDASLAAWEELLPNLQLSNLSQADDIPNKLQVVGKRLAKPGAPLTLSAEQLELLAEMEHGRWNVERLNSGWEHGRRQPQRHATPYVRPWRELPDDVKDYDRAAVASIAGALESTGWGIRDV